MVTAPFKLTLYSGAFGRLGWINDALSIRATPKHNLIGTLEFTIPSTHRYASALLSGSTRVVSEYDGKHCVGGPVRHARGDMASGTLTFTVEDDFRLLARILAWPVPGSAIGSQSGAEYYTLTDNAETVAKAVIQANVTRLGLPVTVASDLGRGAVVEASFRMHPIADRLLPVIDTAGIGITVRQVGASLVVDCYEPATYPRTVTAASGVVRNWSYEWTAANATRAVIGGGGEGTARVFRAVTDSALETASADVVEVFVDARDTSDSAVMDQRGTDALAEGAVKSGISLTLAESRNFRYGTTFSVGDVLPVEVGPGLTVTDVLRSASLTWNAQEGLQVVPAVGDPNATNPITTTARAIASLLRGQRNQNARS